MQTVVDRLDGAATILLCAPSGRDDGLCHQLLADGAADGRTVLWVSFDRTADECLAALPEVTGDRAVLTVGGSPTPGSGVDEDVTVDTVSARSDLTALGIKLSRFLSSTDGAISVCFDSVTAMLQHVALDTAYEFLHTVTRQCFAEGARVHFHLDPAAHDQRTVAIITSLCDARVTAGEAPEVRVRPGLFE